MFCLSPSNFLKAVFHKFHLVHFVPDSIQFYYLLKSYSIFLFYIFQEIANMLK